MNQQFYLTLPSNSEKSNTASTFETLLPRNIILNGDWEVGLAEIIYANTWHNVSVFQNKMKFVDVKSGSRQIMKIPASRYSNISDLVKTINQAIAKFSLDYPDFIKLAHSEYSKLCEFMIDAKRIKDFTFSTHLQYMLGFSEKQLSEYADSDSVVLLKALHPPDMFGGMHYLYVYCDIVEPQIVGNKLAPLIQVVNVEGNYMEIINHSYISPHYVPVLKKSFNTIEINIKNDMNEPVPFEFGKTIIKLHFRRL